MIRFFEIAAVSLQPGGLRPGIDTVTRAERDSVLITHKRPDVGLA